MTEPISIDPVAAVKSVAAQVGRIPSATYQPPPAEEGEAPPPPVTTPEQVVLELQAVDMPLELVNPITRKVNLASTVAMLWQLLHSLEIRTTIGRVLLDEAPGGVGGSIWGPGQSAELDVTWDEPPPMVPTALVVRVETSIVNAAKIDSWLVPGTLTATGCTVHVENVSSGSAIVSPSQPVLIRTEALYLHTPPLTSQETP